MTETQNLLTLSKIIQDKFENVTIQNLDNPRKELKSNDLNVCNKKFLDLGLNPLYINGDRIQEIYDYIQKYNSNIKNNVILPSSKW